MSRARWVGVLTVGVGATLCGCGRGEPAFLAPHTYNLQGTTVVSSGPPDSLCGAAADEAGPEETQYVMQPPHSVELEMAVSIDRSGATIVSDGGGCSMPVLVNEAQDRLTVNDHQCELAEDAPVRQWGVTERKYLRLVLDFANHTWLQSLRSLASDNNRQANVQCVVGEGIILGGK